MWLGLCVSALCGAVVRLGFCVLALYWAVYGRGVRMYSLCWAVCGPVLSRPALRRSGRADSAALRGSGRLPGCVPPAAGRGRRPRLAGPGQRARPFAAALCAFCSYISAQLQGLAGTLYRHSSPPVYDGALHNSHVALLRSYRLASDRPASICSKHAILPGQEVGSRARGEGLQSPGFDR